MNILTIINEDDSLTRLVIGCDQTALATATLLDDLGYTLEHGYGDVPARPQDELTRVNMVLDRIYNRITQELGIVIPPPPVQ